MDKGVLRNFAINARNDLEERIENKINSYFIAEKFTVEQRGDLYYLKSNNHSLTLSSSEFEKRELLIKRIDELTLERVIEEAAYTWFNRLIAIRYMEIHDYLPLTKDNLGLGIRVLSSINNEVSPEILKYQNLINTKIDIKFNKNIFEKLKTENDKFKYVLNLIIDKIKIVIPQVFGGVTDYVDTLLPENLLNDDSFIHNLILDIPETYFDDVEIIGWLYQYYNQTKKDEVISSRKTYKTHEIPYATQLFTPDWIVKYMVQNSLGKYWIENSHTNNEDLIKSWKYLIKENIVLKNNKISPEEITFIDPCSGSGHILVYAFDLLYQIYLTSGYPSQIIPSLIINKNLFGLDIDDRAGQLSILSILLKSREIDKDIFNKPESRNLNILSIQELKKVDEYSMLSLPEEYQNKISELIKEFSNAKEIGSLSKGVEKDYTKLLDYINKTDFIVKSNLENKLTNIISQNKILTKKYDVIVTNPPYITNKYLSDLLKETLKTNYEDGTADLFAAFILRCSMFAHEKSYISLMTPNVWMFLPSYNRLRNAMLNYNSLKDLVYLNKGSFFQEATVDIIAFTFNKNVDNNKTLFVNLDEFEANLTSQEKGFLKIVNESNSPQKIVKSKDFFLQLPRSPLAFWISDTVKNAFQEKPLSEYGEAKQGIATANNNRFLRFWYEIDYRDFSLVDNINKTKYKWYPYNKGGAYRKWYGNFDYVVNWQNDGFEIKNYRNSSGKLLSRPQNLDFMFKEGITWTLLSSSYFGVRYLPAGFVSDINGMAYFSKDKTKTNYLLGFFSTKVMEHLLMALNSTFAFQSGDIMKTPIIISQEKINDVTKIVSTNIELSQKDWDLYETSWNFQVHPLIFESRISHFGRKGEQDHLIENLFEHLKTSINMRFEKLKENEEELNKVFINIYNLQKELSYKVEDKNVTLTKIFESSNVVPLEIKGNKYIKTKEDVVKSFISYFVGCLFGRYSLDQDGIVFAGGNFNYGDYKKFKPLKDNIIPITDNKYFAEDIVYKFLEFIEILFSKETLNENVEFIANTLGKKDLETDVETIRRYFINDFYRDHVQTYKKKPIYWLFNSGKDDGFKGLMYIHRYDENLIPKIRLDYVHAMQNIYQRELEEVKYKLSTDLVLTEKKNLQDREVDLNKKIVELNNYDELIAHAANQRITLDLDDGIDVNYDKLKELLAKK